MFPFAQNLKTSALDYYRITSGDSGKLLQKFENLKTLFEAAHAQGHLHAK